MLTRRALVVAVVLASAAGAQSPSVPTADIEQMWVDPAGRGSLLVGNGLALEPSEFRVGAVLSYTYGNLRSARSSPSLLLRDRVGAQVFGAVGLTHWLEVSANVPVIIAQTGGGELGVASGGLGNPFLGATVNLLDKSKVIALSVGLGVGIPVGTGAAQGNGGIEVMPRLTLGKVFDDYALGVELSGLVRPMVDYSEVTHAVGDKVGTQASLAVMVATVNTSGPRGELTVRGFLPLTGANAGLEGQIGVRWPVGDLELITSIGPGFSGEPATPMLRAYLGVAFANVPLTQPLCVEGRDYPIDRCPDLDKDGDGVKNGVDRAPTEPEDRDGFQDEDGAPDPDNDGDGVLDVNDRCPNVAGPAGNQGCPDTDRDGDGIVDRLDKCPDEPEDHDGFQDEDGCPDPDNDGDGISDVKDACPNEAGIPEEKGCPAKDSDGDTVLDFQDNCPTEKGPPENQGCPVAQKQLVVITRDRLKILDRVYFDTGQATIQRRSNALLDQIAAVLTAHSEIPLVQIEGHTDNVGKPEKNKKLSQDRADAVKAYLVKKGIPDPRLKAVGFGQDKPSQPNDTAQGREANRRVEFNLVWEGDEPPAP